MAIDEFVGPDLAREVDRLCDRFETEWQEGGSPQIESYLQTAPRAKRPSLLRQLLLIEWELCAAAGQSVELAAFQRRFPQDQASVAAAWAEFSESRAIGAAQEPSSEDAATETFSDNHGIPEQLGRYRIRRFLGQGGYGQVYLAHDEELRRDVAIKVPSPELLARCDDFDSFVAEARTLAALDHPNIVPVYDVGRTPECPCYVVSKYMEGPDLAQTIKQGRLGHDVAASLVASIAEALQVAHEKKIVHRDVKPANILLDSSGRPHIADFGLALNDERYGQPAGVVGTPAYMSPEQVRREGHLVDGRSDIFSLGVVLYELLTGERPFAAARRRDVMERIATVDARPPRQLDRSIPQELERICLKCLSKRPIDRYSNASDMAADIRAWLHQETSTIASREAGSSTHVSSRMPVPLRAATADEVRASDIVISCAQLDNQPLGPLDDGWVSRFHQNLKVRMEQLLGEPIQVASLPMSSSEPSADDTVVDSISSAKTLVSVVSPPFTKTPQCVRSIKEFWEAAERSGEFCVQDKPRLFKVMKSPVPSEDIPADLSELFARLFGFEFYEQDPETGRIREFDEVFGPTLKQRFHERVYDLAHDVSQLLRAYRKSGEGTFRGAAPRAPSEVTQVVYLATTTTDVQDQRDRIRRELVERGCVVLPDSSPPLSAQELERFVQNCLKKCTLAIHLLGKHYGVTPEDCDQSLPAMQLMLSARHAEDSNLQRLLWMPHDDGSADRRQAEFLRTVRETPSMHHRAELIEGDLNLLKSILISRLTPAAPQGQAGRDANTASGPPKLYLVCERRDEENVEALEDYLFGQGLEVCLPAFDGSDADAIALHRENLVTCDALLVYYGAAPRAWVDIKLRDVLKAPGYGRENPIGLQGVFIAPPMDHRKDRFKSLQATVIRGADGFEGNGELNDFVATVKGG